MGARDTRRRLRNRLTLFVVALLLMVMLATPALAAELEVEPSPVAAGEWVTVEGEDFGFLALVSLSFDGALKTSVLADDDGEFETSLQVPADTGPGPHAVTAASLFASASATIVVTGGDTTTTTSTTTTSPTTTTAPTTTTTTPSTTTTTSPATTSTAPPSAPSTTTTLSPTTTRPTATTTTSPFPKEPEESTTTTRPSSTSTTGLDDTSTTTSTTLPPVTTAITLPFTDDGWAFGARPQPGEPTPEIAEARLTIGRFTVEPGSGPPGAVIEFALALDQMLPELNTIELAIGGTQIGDPVTITTASTAVEGTVPNLPPGEYQVTVSHDGVTLASAPFEVTELRVAPGTSTPPQVWLAIPLALVILALGWRTLREIRDGLPPGQRLGPVSAWRVRRGRPPIG